MWAVYADLEALEGYNTAVFVLHELATLIRSQSFMPSPRDYN